MITAPVVTLLILYSCVRKASILYARYFVNLLTFSECKLILLVFNAGTQPAFSPGEDNDLSVGELLNMLKSKIKGPPKR